MSDAVLVTGAFGLIGSATAQRLAADGCRQFRRRRSPNYSPTEGYADPRSAIRDRWGDPRPDGSTP